MGVLIGFFVPGDLDLWHSNSFERGTKQVFPVNLVQIRSAVPEVYYSQTKWKTKLELKTFTKQTASRPPSTCTPVTPSPGCDGMVPSPGGWRHLQCTEYMRTEYAMPYNALSMGMKSPSGDLDLWPWHSNSSERGNVFPVNLVQIRSAVPEIFDSHTKNEKVTDSTKNRILRSSLRVVHTNYYSIITTTY